MATFDVIIPAYNAETYLSQALDSVVAQSFTDWRILLIDDGSQDRTADIAASYQDRLGSKLKYIRQVNAGVSAARNTAIRHATANFLALLDADDVWLPMRLQKTWERFQASPEAGLTYGFNARIDASGRILDVFDRRRANAEGRIAQYLYRRTLDLPALTVTVRRSCLETVGGFDETLRTSEDRDVWTRVAARYDTALIPEVIALYRVLPQSASSDPDRMAQGQLRVVEKNYGLPGCGWLSRRVALSWIYRQRAEAQADKGQLSTAVRDAVRALGYYPFQLHNARTLASLVFRRARGLVPARR